MVTMLAKIKTHWKLIALIVLGLCIIRMSACARTASDKFVESLYQQVQEEHRAEFARRQANIKKLETMQLQTALDYQVKIDQFATAADKRIKANGWKTNEALRKEKASSEQILLEKGKVEAALGEMTANRDGLIVAAHARETEIFSERAQMNIEYKAAITAKIQELDDCEKARADALGRTNRRTWISIGPSSTVYMKNGTIYHAFGISIQIPVIEIKSPFKRF
jgi:hypothetical protein